jgi:hypothetical protein
MLRKIRLILFLACLVALLAACAQPQVTLKIDRHPAAADFSSINPQPAPPAQFNPNSGNFYQNDYRSSNLSGLDLARSLDGLLYSTFDTKTVWPPADKLPVGFDPHTIMELGKDPGLMVRQIQAQGITGSGVGIAILDQPMLVDHQEYSSQLKDYEEINIDPGTGSQLHGPAVSSIAVGKTVGVAPQADLYFIAVWPGTFMGTGKFDYDFSYLATAVRRILQINRSLPGSHKIRVISISLSWHPDQKGYADMLAAVNDAKKAGIFVISMSLHDTYGWNMMGMGRSLLADPNDFSSYTVPATWSGSNFDPQYFAPGTLLIPIDARTIASPTGPQDYVFYRQGGLSWTAPYLAGVYALACQVDPQITPQKFWSTALSTGRAARIEHNGKQYPSGVLLDPQALLAALQK